MLFEMRDAMFRYTITPEDYMEMTVYLMKQKSGTASSVIKLLLFTVGQMAAVAYMVLRESSASVTIRVLLAISSLIWAGQTVFRYGFFQTRAKMAMSVQKKDDPSGEFWREHHLSKKGNLLSVTYGSKKADIPCGKITGTQETENLTLIMSGNNIIEIVPKRITETDEWDVFWKQLQETNEAVLKDAQDKQRADALAGASFKAYYQMDPDTFADHLVKMRRHSMRYFSGWTPATIVIFLLPLMMAGYALTEKSYLYAGVCVIVFFLMNAGQLVVFTPLYKNIVLKQLQEPGKEGYLLTLTKNVIHFFTKEYHYSYSMNNLKHVLDFPEASYYYFPQRQMIFIPEQCRDAFKKAAAHKPSLYELSHMSGKSEDEEDSGKD